MKTNYFRKNGMSAIKDAPMKGHRHLKKDSFLPWGMVRMSVRRSTGGNRGKGDFGDELGFELAGCSLGYK